MNIAHLKFNRYPLFLAPMDEVTDTSFRFICKYFGADMMYTEFVAADGLIRNAASTVAKLRIYDYERPIGIQLYGHLIDPMVEAAQIVAQVSPDVIDLNFGCPIKKIAARGAGSGMMREPDKMLEMTRRIVNAVKIPVTVKTRLGWDENSKIIVDLAERLQDTGIAAITIHGRTRAQLYKGEADWSLIGAVKNNRRMYIPVIGNGDINSPERAKEMFDRYGVDAVMIGRATYGRPWIFREIKHYLEHGELLPDIPIHEKVALAKLHLNRSLEEKGAHTGVLEMRRHLSHYFKALPNFKETRQKLVTETNPVTIVELLNDIAERWGKENGRGENNTTGSSSCALQE